ncbi:hypothetical protein LCGC14_2609600 [marine sediment metagenome]|uniref:Uncharacterized protein n=1 Tax=marine sediment metagenome TaxID=412755 RepID=A0A0F9CHB0_9ZZZZ
MSMEYCKECDLMIDLDYNSEHEHTEDMIERGKLNYAKFMGKRFFEYRGTSSNE